MAADPLFVSEPSRRPGAPYTEEDYLALPEGQRIDLIDGKIPLPCEIGG
jgi:hypothetical protein